MKTSVFTENPTLPAYQDGDSAEVINWSLVLQKVCTKIYCIGPLSVLFTSQSVKNLFWMELQLSASINGSCEADSVVRLLIVYLILKSKDKMFDELLFSDYQQAY